MTNSQRWSPADVLIGDRITIWGNGGAVGAKGDVIRRGFTIEVTKISKRWNCLSYGVEGYHLTTTGARRKGEPIRYAEIAGQSGGTAPAQWRMSSRDRTAG